MTRTLGKLYRRTEIADKPEDVGPPVDILFIGINQMQWIQKKPGCPTKHYGIAD